MINIYEQISACERNGREAALCIIVNTTGSTPRKPGAKMLVFPDKTILGTIGGGHFEKTVTEEAIQVLESGRARMFDHNLTTKHDMSCGGKIQVYIEPIGRKYQLFVFGAGHIGSLVAEQANRLGFRVTVIDERTELIRQINIDGVRTINKNHKDAFADLLFDKRTFITSVSHLHEYDREIVAHCAKHPHAYLGMIGSKRKIATAKKIFTENKLLSETEMDRIDWPMGIPIECQTPEEIVISILAKLIDVRGKLMKAE